jgi:hypothetical protein
VGCSRSWIGHRPVDRQSQGFATWKNRSRAFPTSRWGSRGRAIRLSAQRIGAVPLRGGCFHERKDRAGLYHYPAARTWETEPMVSAAMMMMTEDIRPVRILTPAPSSMPSVGTHDDDIDRLGAFLRTNCSEATVGPAGLVPGTKKRLNSALRLMSPATKSCRCSARRGTGGDFVRRKRSIGRAVVYGQSL